jgi:hypothetical protein
VSVRARSWATTSLAALQRLLDQRGVVGVADEVHPDEVQDVDLAGGGVGEDGVQVAAAFGRQPRAPHLLDLGAVGGVVQAATAGQHPGGEPGLEGAAGVGATRDVGDLAADGVGERGPGRDRADPGAFADEHDGRVGVAQRGGDLGEGAVVALVRRGGGASPRSASASPPGRVGTRRQASSARLPRYGPTTTIRALFARHALRSRRWRIGTSSRGRARPPR